MTELSEAIMRAAKTLDDQAVKDTVDELRPWLQHRLECNLSYQKETLKPGRWVCTCGLEMVLAAILEEA